MGINLKYLIHYFNTMNEDVLKKTMKFNALKNMIDLYKNIYHFEIIIFNSVHLDNILFLDHMLQIFMNFQENDQNQINYMLTTLIQIQIVCLSFAIN